LRAERRDLLQEVAQQSPAMQSAIRDNLRRVNEYIQDAKSVVAAESERRGGSPVADGGLSAEIHAV
jgi:hypothetical protein